jgi:hypothetical protein
MIASRVKLLKFKQWAVQIAITVAQKSYQIDV